MTLRVRELDDHERVDVQRTARSHTLGAALVRRAQIVIHARDGLKAEEIATRMDLCGNTVRHWPNRFNARGLEGLKEDVRGGRPLRLRLRGRFRPVALTQAYDMQNSSSGPTPCRGAATGAFPATCARLLTAGVLALAVSAGSAHAAVTTYTGPAGLAAFNVAAGSPGIAISFDALLGNLAGATIGGVTFSSPEGNSLEVVTGASTFTPAGFSGVINAATNVLIPTSGGKVMSPGGSELAPGPNLKQRDSLRLDFATPLSAFGLDVLLQSIDDFPLASITVYDAALNVIGSGGIPGAGGGGGPGATSFFGVFSSTGNISRIVITDGDDNDIFPDANLGYDSFRFQMAQAGVPEPATWALMIAGFGLMGQVVRRRARTVPVGRPDRAIA